MYYLLVCFSVVHITHNLASPAGHSVVYIEYSREKVASSIWSARFQRRALLLWFCAGLWNNLINERLKYHETAIISHSIIEAKLIWTCRLTKEEAMSIVIKISSVCGWTKKRRFLCDFLKIAHHIDVLGERKTWDLSWTQSREIWKHIPSG